MHLKVFYLKEMMIFIILTYFQYSSIDENSGLLKGFINSVINRVRVARSFNYVSIAREIDEQLIITIDLCFSSTGLPTLVLSLFTFEKYVIQTHEPECIRFVCHM